MWMIEAVHAQLERMPAVIPLSFMRVPSLMDRLIVIEALVTT